MSCPNRRQAEMIWQQGIDYSREHHIKSEQVDREYICHTRGVAEFSFRFAQKMGLDADKAYVLGLLHDYGKRRNEKQENCFHGIMGYYDMLELGYEDVAKICLTHTFVHKNFANEDYSYPDSWLDECRKLLFPLVYDDYDLIVQYADMFFEGVHCITPEKRVTAIAERYGLTSEQKNKLIDLVSYLKTSIDNKCQCDSYQLLGLV